MPIANYLSPARTFSGDAGSSKKRVLEFIANFISQDKPALVAGDLFKAMVNREKLGSTALGQGVAIPHCRVSSCTAITGALLRLNQPVDFDAPDQQGVDIVFALLVPVEACDDHLQALAELAGLFNDPAFLQRLRSTDDPAALYQMAIQGPAGSNAEAC